MLIRDTVEDEAARETLTALAGDDFSVEVTKKRVSVLDLLERFPNAKVPLEAFLTMLPPMRVRQYSISSSPLQNPHRCTLSYSVLDQPAFSGRGRFTGVATSYLANLNVGDALAVSVRSSNSAFKLPAQPEQTPLILAGAGSGIAPFRGFIQERAAQIKVGRTLAPALLFFGCRGPEIDDLYAEEFAQWEAIGAVKVFRAYSRAPELSNGCKHVQDIFWNERDAIVEVWNQGAKVYVCGSQEVGKGVREASIRIGMEQAEKHGKEPSREDAENWFEGIRNERYATDVFA